MPRSWHDVDGGDATGAGFLESRVAHVDSIDDANVRLNRRAAITTRGAGANVAVCIHDARHNHFARKVVLFSAVGNLHVGRGAS